MTIKHFFHGDECFVRMSVTSQSLVIAKVTHEKTGAHCDIHIRDPLEITYEFDKIAVVAVYNFINKCNMFDGKTEFNLNDDYIVEFF